MEPKKPEPRKPEPEFQRFYHQLLSPLSLFPRKVTAPEPPKRRPKEVSNLQTLPLAKLKVASLCRQVAKLLANCGLVSWVPSESRVRLIEVILDELKCSWQEPPAEPSLSYANNQKLRKRLESYVLLSCEQLFLRYLHLLVTMPVCRKVFTESATLSRLSASLARDCTIFLTSPDVYRGLLADFQALLRAEQAHSSVDKRRPACPAGTFKLCPIPWPHSTGFAQVPCSSLNLNYLIQLSRPPEFFSEPELDPMKELKSIPQLKSRKTLRWLPTIKKERDVDFASSQMVSQLSPTAIPTGGTYPYPTSSVFSQLQRGQSLPSLREGWKLADELGLPEPPLRPLTPLILAAECKTELTEDTVAEDLKQKMKNMNLEWSRPPPLDSGLPPLLGVVTRRIAAEHHMEELQIMLKNLEEEEASWRWGLQPPKSPPLHPQPVTTTLKFRNEVVVQTATVQLSERNFLDAFQVEEARVLYNHLDGELDSKVIQDMDSNRLVDRSTKEVYKELLSRVSSGHLSFDQGDLVEPSADKDWSAFLSSTFLHQEKQFLFINPDLARCYSQRANDLLAKPDKMPSLTSPHTVRSWEMRANKASWMNWWQANLSADDYFKYLTNQETDFLHVIFQMYKEETPVETAVLVKESLQIQHPPPLLEDEEPDFIPGEWDWNTVLEHRLRGGKTQVANLQKRLERLWSMLEVPSKDRLDMAIKYSSSGRITQLPLLVRAWERALKPIQQREVLLGRLEWFERQASDPNRFFQKAELDMSHFLEESQFRCHLHKKLSQMEPSLTSLLKEIESAFGEPVTFKGRRYLDKMERDRVEMLYWLQQQRRIRHLVRAKKISQVPGLFRRNSSQPLRVPGNTPVIL